MVFYVFGMMKAVVFDVNRIVFKIFGLNFVIRVMDIFNRNGVSFQTTRTMHISLYFGIMIFSKLFLEKHLGIGINLCVGIRGHLYPLFIQKLYDGSDSHVQIACYFT